MSSTSALRMAHCFEVFEDRQHATLSSSSDTVIPRLAAIAEWRPEPGAAAAPAQQVDAEEISDDDDCIMLDRAPTPFARRAAAEAAAEPANRIEEAVHERETGPRQAVAQRESNSMLRQRSSPLPVQSQSQQATSSSSRLSSDGVFRPRTSTSLTPASVLGTSSKRKAIDISSDGEQ